MTAVRTLSVFFPAHDEAENLERTVTDCLAMLDGLELDAAEVVIVDDGSTDGTGVIADRLANDHEVVRAVHHDGNQGYGAALKTGFATATLDWVFYSDSDGQFDLTEIHLLLPHAGRCDAVVGYRAERADNLVRRANQAVWGALVGLVLGLRLRDVDCAFKLIRTAALRQLGPLASDGAVISSELLAKLQRAGNPVHQVPVSHLPRIAGRPSGGSPRVILRALGELARLRRVLRRWAPAEVPGAMTGPERFPT